MALTFPRELPSGVRTSSKYIFWDCPQRDAHGHRTISKRRLENPDLGCVLKGVNFNVSSYHLGVFRGNFGIEL
jgi:hypothetical protein